MRWRAQEIVTRELGPRTHLTRGRELREIVEELEVPPSVVRDLWHEWRTELQDGEIERRKSVQGERRCRQEDKELREIERRSEQEQKNFELTMTATTAAALGDKR